MAYIPLTFLSILLIPGAIQWEFPALRGLAPHKNMLGQVSLVSLIVWSFSARVTGFRKKMVAFLFWGLSFVLLIGSRSTTSLLAFAFFLLLAGFWYTGNLFLRPTIGPFLSATLLLSFLLFLLFTFYSAFDSLASLFGLLGKDITLTGRIDIWSSVFQEAKKHFFLGCGFGGFWGIDTPTIDSISTELGWFVNQSHSGYLDILNETGVVGISLVAFMMVSYFKNLLNLEQTHFWKWFVIAVLIANISESTLFRPNELTGELLIFSYLALYVQVIRGKGGFS
jgi:O-antigen ligase